MKEHPRIEAARAMIGCCIFGYLLISVASDQFAFKLSGDQFAFAIMLVAASAAAWLVEPQSKSETTTNVGAKTRPRRK